MTLFNLNNRWHSPLIILLSITFLSSCATGKKTAAPSPPVLVSVPDTIETYSCGFERGSYSGTLPCFGDECGEFGAPLTTLLFKPQQVLLKNTEQGNNRIDNTTGRWTINKDCIIEISYSNGTLEYYKFHKGINKIERLTANQESFPGTLNKHNYLSKIK